MNTVLHVLIGENATYDQLMDATQRTLPRWIVPKKAKEGDQVALFFPGKGGFVALGKLKEDARGTSPPYLAHIVHINRFSEAISIAPESIPGWAWLTYPRKYTTPAPQYAKQLLAALGQASGLSSPRNAQVPAVLPTRENSSKRQPPEEDLDAQSLLSGSGYENDPAKRRAIELHAMARAKKHYHVKKRFAVVEDTSATCPYDLRCMKGPLEVRVEVKGTTTDGAKVLLTRGEVENAKGTDWRTDLFIVSKIKVTSVKGKVVASGGEERFIENWQPADEDLSAILYRYKVRDSPRARRPRR